jgi:hypothetical protein
MMLGCRFACGLLLLHGRSASGAKSEAGSKNDKLCHQ